MENNLTCTFWHEQYPFTENDCQGSMEDGWSGLENGQFLLGRTRDQALQKLVFVLSCPLNKLER